MNITESTLAMAFEKSHEADLRKIHLTLNKGYYNFIFSENRSDHLTKSRLNKWKRVESVWFKREQRECLKNYNCYRQVHDKKTVEEALVNHPVYNHPLFDYFCYHANLNDLKIFFLAESILNLEFFDYLAFAIIGSCDTAKAEIATNLWEEAGRGNIHRFHTSMFKKLMSMLDLHYDRNHIIENMSWEALAGINLFSYFSIYSYNKTKYFGLLAATEMLDPLHYNKLINGLIRIFPQQTVDYSYYIEHEQIDVEHANGWLEKVVFPELTEKPEKIHEFWLGFYMRLNSAQQYYDKLLSLYKNNTLRSSGNEIHAYC